MSRSSKESAAYLVASVAVVAAALGTLATSSAEDVETALLMVTAVIGGLVCFDIAMERKVDAFGPWLLLSLAPIVKTVPTVWQKLRSDSGANFERYEHIGTLGYGLLVMAAVALLARPAPRLGSGPAWFSRLVISGSALTIGLSGAAVAYRYDPAFESTAIARVLETATWTVVGGLAAAIAIVAGHVRMPTRALTGVLVVSAAVTAVLAYTAAGNQLDRGWFALLFAGFALSGSLSDADFGLRMWRDRQSNVGVVVAVVAGTVGAAAAIAARGDKLAWSGAWVVLGALAMAMFALAMLFRPSVPRQAEEDLDEFTWGSEEFEREIRTEDTGFIDVRSEAARLAEEKQRALSSLQSAPAFTTGAVEAPVPVPSAPPAEPVAVPAANVASVPAQQADAPAEPVAAIPGPPAAYISASPVPQGETDPSMPAPAPVPAPPMPVPPVEPMPVAPSQPVPDPPVPVAAPAHTPSHPTPAATGLDVPRLPAQHGAMMAASAEPAEGLSGASAIAEARAAAAVREAPSNQRHALAPVDQAHNFDPSTGLLSASGLQLALKNAFAVPRPAGHVTLALFTIRDLDALEERYGRLAAAAVTRAVAGRVQALLPDGTSARFGRSAYAIVLIGDRTDVAATVQELTQVLLQLRAPVEGGSLGDKIDVVAGMAQCYDNESVATFVARANEGLAKAVHTPTPTFVAMP